MSRHALKSSAAKRPVCVFALKNREQQSAIESVLEREGLDAVFVGSFEEVLAEQSKAECFGVFIDTLEFPQARDYRAANAKQEKVLWVALAPPLNQFQLEAFYAQGWVDVLALPIHAFLVGTRATGLLARFLRKHGMPDDVLIPDGLVADEKTPAIFDFESSLLSGRSSARRHKKKETSMVIEDATRPPVRLGNRNPSFGNHSVPPSRLAFYDEALEKLVPFQTFFKPVAREQREQYLSEVLNRPCIATIWAAQQQWKGIFQLLSFDPKQQRMTLGYSKEWNPDQVIADFERLKVENLFVSLSFNSALIFFSVPVREMVLEKFGLRVTISPEIYAVQRRSHFRLRKKGALHLREHFQIKIATSPLEDPAEYAVADLSANGCQLVLSQEQAHYFREEQFCPQVLLDLYGREVECAATVKWKKLSRSKALPGDEAFRVGLQFMRVKPDDEVGLQLYVMEESYSLLQNLAQSRKK